ncbi:DEAD/DEAH box helicase [Kitasatospora sp. NPDC048538]|uniref:DEAD/DEAH box helicase n=1 Tax=Kitasatospora sp. NPDC048538 TaxID=3155633 RepID=UPI0033CB1BAC
MRDDDGTLRRLGAVALGLGAAAAPLRSQLRSDILARQIGAEGRADYTYRPERLRDGLALARIGQLARTPRERRTDPGPLAQIAQAYADLAELPELSDDPAARVELMAIAATMWSLGGYQANATAIARGYRFQVQELFSFGDAPGGAVAAAPYRIALAASAVLERDIDEAARLGAVSAGEVRRIGLELTDAAAQGLADESDFAVLAAYGLVGRAAGRLAALWRTGDRAAGRAAVADVNQAAQILHRASVVDTWTLVDCLAHAVEDIVATSPWLLLRRASTWNRAWERYLRALIVSRRPITQVWPSQRTALEAGLLDAAARPLAVTMPTSAGKTHIAEWAILHALAASADHDDSPFGLLLRYIDPPLAVYVVPTRALAAQVERHLAASLELVGLRVSSLFGGNEHVRYENGVLETTDVLVVTTEKLDLLLRNTPSLADRLRLVLVDEGHEIDRSERGLRLEMVLTRIRRTAARARIVLLSAVLPNGADIARWLDPSADGANHADVDWSPSQLRVGVFYWEGKERDGQGGRIQYGSGRRDDFFVPRVLTRNLVKTRAFPRKAGDVAAALALHFDRLGPVLISASTPANATGAALALLAALDREGIPSLVAEYTAGDQRLAERRAALRRDVGEHLGEQHPLTGMVARGIAYHHGSVPQAVRTLLERGYRDGVLRVLCATSTLSQGMNLPVKTVLVHSTARGRGRWIDTREFWNTAGRAGRAFQETEGHVILIAEDEKAARRLRNRYLDKRRIEPVLSRIKILYDGLAQARLGTAPGPQHDLDAFDLPDPEPGELADWANALDLQLLAMLAEEVVDTGDQHLLEEAAQDLLAHTLGGHQIGAQDLPLKPLARFAARRVATLAHRLPDPAARAAILRTGLSLQGGLDALAAAEHIARTLAEQPELNAFWPGMRLLILRNAMHVQEVHVSAGRRNCTFDPIYDLADDWIAGHSLQQLHADHHEETGAKDTAATSVLLDDVVTNNLAWAVSSILQILETRHGITPGEPLATLPAMLKYGVDSAAACYAFTLGVDRRGAAIELAEHCPLDAPTFADFRIWLSGLSADELTALTDPDTAARLIRSTERHSPRTVQKTILGGRGTFTTPLRGVRHADSARHLAGLPEGTFLGLFRDRGNSADPNAIAVEHDGRRLGWIGRDTARPLALALDDPHAPYVTARLHTDARRLAAAEGLDQIAAHDRIHLDVTLHPAP